MSDDESPIAPSPVPVLPRRCINATTGACPHYASDDIDPHTGVASVACSRTCFLENQNFTLRSMLATNYDNARSPAHSPGAVPPPAPNPLATAFFASSPDEQAALLRTLQHSLPGLAPAAPAPTALPAAVAAKIIKRPTFTINGSRQNGKPLTEQVTELARYLRNTQTPRQHWVTVGSSYLDGRALSFYNDASVTPDPLNPHYTVKVCDCNDWDLFVRTLVARFPEDRPENRIWNDFHSVKQIRGVSAYIADFDLYLGRINACDRLDNPQPREIRMRFLAGLRRNVRDAIEEREQDRATPYSLAELQAKAQLLDRSLNPYVPSPPAPKTINAVNNKKEQGKFRPPLTSEERERRTACGECSYHGGFHVDPKSLPAGERSGPAGQARQNASCPKPPRPPRPSSVNHLTESSPDADALPGIAPVPEESEEQLFP